MLVSHHFRNKMSGVDDLVGNYHADKRTRVRIHSAEVIEEIPGAAAGQPSVISELQVQ